MAQKRNAGELPLWSLAMYAIIFIVAAAVLAVGLQVNKDLRKTMACPSGYSFIENATFPDGRCCTTANVDECGTATNGTHGFIAFTAEGNTTLDAQTAALNISARFPLLATVAILSVVILVLLFVFRGVGPGSL